jgi:DNA polymerase III subunit delta
MLIFLYGEDTFRSRQKLLEIKNKYLENDQAGSGLAVFDFESQKEAGKKIMETVGTPNLLAPKRLIIAKNLFSAEVGEQEKIREFLKNKKNIIEDKDTIIIFWEEILPKKSQPMFKYLEKNSQSQDFKKLTGVRLKQWILKIMKEIDPRSEISQQALEKLIVFCGDNNFLLYSELQKLASFADSRMISEKDVEFLVKANLSDNIFKMVDALGAGNKKEALHLFHEHLEKGDDPYYLLSMFFYQFRNMLKIADLYEKNIRSEYEISKITKLHPFVVKKSLAQIMRFSFAKLKDIYQKLSQLDTSAKTGKIEIKLALDKFVAEL